MNKITQRNSCRVYEAVANFAARENGHSREEKKSSAKEKKPSPEFRQILEQKLAVAGLLH